MRREDLNRDLTNKRCALFGIIRYLASSPSLLECHYWFWCVSVSVRSLSPFLWHGFWVGCNLYLIFKRTKRVLYFNLLTSGKLYEHLAEIDTSARDMAEYLIKEMAKKQGVTEELKATDMMRWIGLMNNIRACADEIVLNDIVYS